VTDAQTISVALCTYNGERFLARQLQSIQQQTRLPDELVICDDCSTDGTVSILRDFAQSASFPVRVFENQRNLGFVANFEQAISLCAGDLIALSDQDDLWYPIRLERSEQVFQAHPQVGMVFSDGDIIDNQDQPAGTRLWASFGFAGERKQQMLAGDYTVLAGKRFVTGATMMFRSRLRPHCLPVGSGWLHDEWIAPTAAAVADAWPIEEPLIRYRKHASQQVGVTIKPSRREQTERHWIELSRQAGLLQEICARFAKLPLTERGRALLACYEAHLQFVRFRYALPRPRLARLGPMLKQYGTYARYGSGVLSMASDFVLTR
jgi:glycosyltransferase involved in cell wall biosynthesis